MQKMMTFRGYAGKLICPYSIVFFSWLKKDQNTVELLHDKDNFAGDDAAWLPLLEQLNVSHNKPLLHKYWNKRSDVEQPLISPAFMLVFCSFVGDAACKQNIC